MENELSAGTLIMVTRPMNCSVQTVAKHGGLWVIVQKRHKDGLYDAKALGTGAVRVWMRREFEVAGG